MTKTSLILDERIEHGILLVRGHKVLLDEELAALYEVPVKALNQAVSRNLDRFPGDFSFVLSEQEVAILRSQSVTSSWGGRRTPPRAFTEQGVAMLSSVLRSKRAVAVNIEIMRTFVRLRQMMQSHEDLWRKLLTLEKKYDRQFRDVFDAIHALMEPPAAGRRPIGFIAPSSDKKPRARR